MYSSSNNDETLSRLFADVIPSIDVVDAGLLDHLNPSSGKSCSGGYSYSLDCPKCAEKGIRRAFYYAGSGAVVCNRRVECESTSIWDVLLNSGLSADHVISRLYSLSAYERPNKAVQQSKSAAIILRDILRSTLLGNDDILRSFCASRHMSRDDVVRLGYGFYPSKAFVTKVIQNHKLNRKECIDLGYIPEDDNPHDRFANRIVGFWEMSDRRPRIWGRCIQRSPQKPTLKYIYTSSEHGFTRVTPYMFYRKEKGKLYVSEGMLDADSLHLVKHVWSCAVGSNLINGAQASFLAAHHVSEIAFISDGDRAGLIGAIKSVFNAEAVGLEIHLCILSAEDQDIDYLREQGNLTQIDNILANEQTAALFLADVFATATREDDRKILTIFSNRFHDLSTRTRNAFNDSVRSSGYSFSPENEAVKVFSTLLSNGFPAEQAARIIQRKYGFTITIEATR